MVDVITFLTTLYVMVDDFCKAELEQEIRPGPRASLNRSEVITLAVFGQWQAFPSERAFYRYATRHLRTAFPTLPHRTQWNRLMRLHWPAIVLFCHHLVELMDARRTPYEVMDCTAVATRNVKRRHEGWLVGHTAIGLSNRLGWFEGFKLLLAVTPTGAITGYGFGPGDVREHPLTEIFLGARCYGHPQLPMVGRRARGPYLVDKGFLGKPNWQHWRQDYRAELIGLPQPTAKALLVPKATRVWLAGLRQIVETINFRLLDTFRLERERPHRLAGFQARLAAKVALHNFCIWLNQRLGRQTLAFADLVAW